MPICTRASSTRWDSPRCSLPLIQFHKLLKLHDAFQLSNPAPAVSISLPSLFYFQLYATSLYHIYTEYSIVLSPIMPQIPSTSSFCPLGAPRIARYTRLSSSVSHPPGFPLTIFPPASSSTHHPAQTSQAQHPPSQYPSNQPAATAAMFKAADPKLLRLWHMPPSLAASFLNTSVLRS